MCSSVEAILCWGYIRETEREFVGSHLDDQQRTVDMYHTDDHHPEGQSYASISHLRASAVHGR